MTASALRYQKDKLFVHVDKKSVFAPFEEAVKGLDNVVFVSDRIKNYWGGFHSIIATMETLRLALSDETRYNRFVLLQGKDYPLHHPAYIHRFFDEKWEEEFLKAHDISENKEDRDRMSAGGYWIFDTDSWLVKKVFARILHKLNAVFKIPYRKKTFTNNGQQWHVFKGWAQFSLTRDCVEHILDVYDTNKEYNRYMRHRFPPDEIYIHTIVHNSKFAGRVSEYLLKPVGDHCAVKNELNLTYFEYPVQVTVFDETYSYQDLNETGALFARKLVLPDSLPLLNEIDDHIRQEQENTGSF